MVLTNVKLSPLGHSFLSPPPPSSSPFLFITTYRFTQFRISNVSTRRRLLCSASIVEKTLQVSSWLPPETNTNDDYSGWALTEAQIKEEEKRKHKFKHFCECLYLAAGLGAATSSSILVYSFVVGFLASKGITFKVDDPYPTTQTILAPNNSTGGSRIMDAFDFIVKGVVGEQTPECVKGVVREAPPEYASHERSDVSAPASELGKAKGVIIPVAADSTQQKAVQLLKKLKILEDDVKADDLCTRREYARWLVKVNCMLERNPKHRLLPSMLLSGGADQAFDDICIEDPDFWSIQVLAESGIVPSKLSNNTSSFPDYDGLRDKGSVNFSSESFVSRLDLVNWRTLLEYSYMPVVEEQISQKEVGFMDVKMTSLDPSSGLFMDILAGDRSIVRKVFGKSRRLQPQKPATKAQAAVALTGGRMTIAIRTELSRLEAENSAKLAEMEEIRSELLLRGDIQRVWEEKLNEVKAYGLEAVRDFDTAIHDLEQEKYERDKSISEKLKEEAALDCQKQLLLNLKEEVNEMSERLVCEKANYATERQSSEQIYTDLQSKQEAILEVKSILEAEKEALQILRSWIEDEAKRSQAQARILEQVGRRWKWTNGA